MRLWFCLTVLLAAAAWLAGVARVTLPGFIDGRLNAAVHDNIVWRADSSQDVHREWAGTAARWLKGRRGLLVAGVSPEKSRARCKGGGPQSSEQPLMFCACCPCRAVCARQPPR